MTQVIITTSARERDECIERLEDAGYTGSGFNATYDTAPVIKIQPGKRYQTIIEKDNNSSYEQITGTQFLSQKIETI